MPSNKKKTALVPVTCHHIGIFVNDVEKVSRFYTRVLGFQHIRDFCVDAKTMKALFEINAASSMRYLERHGFSVELIAFDRKRVSAKKNMGAGPHHWALCVKDKDRFCRALKKKRVPVIAALRPSGTVYFVKDPENNLVEIRNS